LLDPSHPGKTTIIEKEKRVVIRPGRNLRTPSIGSRKGIPMGMVAVEVAAEEEMIRDESVQEIPRCSGGTVIRQGVKR